MRVFQLQFQPLTLLKAARSVRDLRQRGAQQPSNLPTGGGLLASLNHCELQAFGNAVKRLELGIIRPFSAH